MQEGFLKYLEHTINAVLFLTHQNRLIFFNPSLIIKEKGWTPGRKRNRVQQGYKVVDPLPKNNREKWKQVAPAEKRMQRMKIQAILTENIRNLAANVQSLE